jgi:hypothetical protein
MAINSGMCDQVISSVARAVSALSHWSCKSGAMMMGVRYKTKEGESPFQDSANMSSISCYKCGLHKL